METQGVPVGATVVPEGWRLVNGQPFWDPHSPSYKALLPYKVNHIDGGSPNGAA